MEKTYHFPFWVHLIGLAITFFGWLGFSYLFEGVRSKEQFSHAIIEAFIFTVLMAIVDGVIWGTSRMNRD